MNNEKSTAGIVSRAKKMTEELGLPITRLCKLFGISRSAWYRAVDGDLFFSPETEKKADEVLLKYGF